MRIAVDLGGTQLRAATVTPQGEILQIRTVPTPSRQGPQAVADEICRQVQALTDWEQADAVGVGIPGGIADGGKRITICSNIEGLTDFPLRDELQARLSRPVRLVNDADAACLGESLLGSGRAYDSCCYITVSTGIGGGVCYGGQLLLGAHGSATEFGSMSIFADRKREGELPAGAVESAFSGSALLRRAQALTGRSYAHVGEILVEAAQNAELQALREEFLSGLATLLSNLACVLDPACFVLGGGCMKSHELFWEELQTRYREFTAPVYQDTPILLASLPEPGLAGVALACR